jgi:NADH-quinone oxidoreductase subunit C
VKSEVLAKNFPKITWEESTQTWVVPSEILLEVVNFLKTNPELSMDYASNVSGVDWLPAKVKVKVKAADGIEKEEDKPGYLEVVYHFYSMKKKHGPIGLRCRTNRENPSVPSITPLFRGAEFQEREIYDLYGINFSGHPDLRRILMWDEFKDFPMRRDYKEPDDYEWEPTPHDDVHVKAKAHYTEQKS